MRLRALVILIVAIGLIAGLALTYRAFAARASAPVASNAAASRPSSQMSPRDLTAMFPTGPAPCPSDPNDLAGIEGYAPGAGGAAKGVGPLSETWAGWAAPLG